MLKFCILLHLHMQYDITHTHARACTLTHSHAHKQYDFISELLGYMEELGWEVASVLQCGAV